MSLILAAMLASSPIAASPVAAAPVLPFIDRRALHALAKFEAAKDRTVAVLRPSAARKARKITALCREAGVSGPADAKSDLGRAYSMAGPRVSILRSACLESSASLRTASLANR